MIPWKIQQSLSHPALVLRGTKILHANLAAQELTGFSQEELLKMDFSDIVHPDFHLSLKERELACQHGERPPEPYEVKICRKDGIQLWVEIIAGQIEPDDESAVFLIVLDITERKQTEAALLRRNAVLQITEAIAHDLLQAEVQPGNIQAIVTRLGEMMGVSRAYLFERIQSRRENVQLSLRYEWLAPGIVSLMGVSPSLEAVPITWSSSGAALKDFLENGAFHCLVRDLPEREREYFIAFGTKSVLLAPIFTGQEWWGVIGFDECSREREWTTIEIDSLSIAASFLGVAIHRTRSEQLLQRRAAAMEALYETSLEVNSQRDVPTLLEAIMERAAKLMSVRMGGLYLMRPDERSLELVVSYRLPGDFRGAVLQLGEGLSGRIAETGEPLMVEDYATWPGRAEIYAGALFRRVLGVPLKVGGKVIGAINITDDEKSGPFEEEDVRLLSMFADQAAIAITNARLFEALQQELAERKRAEVALRASDTRFRQLTANSPDFIYIIDLTLGKPVYFNHDHFLDHSLSDWEMPKAILGAVHPDDRAAVLEHWQYQLSGYPYDQFPIEYRFQRKDGRWEWLQSRFTILACDPEGKPTQLLLTTSIITERKRAEEAMAKSLNFYLELFESFPVPIWWTGLDGQINYVNPSWLEFTGRTLEQELGEGWAERIHPDDLAAWRQTYRIAFHHREPFEFEYRLRHADGSYHSVKISGRPFLDFKDEFAGYIGIIYDITEMKEAQQRLVELSLERERVRMLEELIGNVSHDLRTPLSTIILNTYLLKTITDPTKQQERLNILETQADRLQRVVQDLLDLSRLEIDITEMTFTEIEVNPLIADVAELFAPRVAEKNLRLSLDIDRPLPMILANETQFQRSIMNLIDNAVKYTDQGTISIRTYQQAQSVVIEVADTGVGISPNDIPFIFNRFFKGDKARSSEGSGLGLAITKKIVEAHGGKVEVKSAPGQGTTFTVSIPIYPAETSN